MTCSGNLAESEESSSCNPQLREAFQEAFEQLPAKSRENLLPQPFTPTPAPVTSDAAGGKQSLGSEAWHDT